MGAARRASAVRSAVRSRALVSLASAVLGLLAVGSGQAVRAQASLVPVHHPVYEWLYRQRVAGRVPVYAFEALPLSRGEVQQLLDSLESDAGEMDAADRALLRAYTRELSPAALVASGGVSLLQGPGSVEDRVASVARGEREPHLLVHVDSSITATVDGLAAVGVSRDEEPGPKGTPALPELGVRAYGTVDERFGVHAEVGRMFSSGTVRAVRHDDRYGRTAEVVEDGAGGSWYVQAMASAHFGHVSVDAGQGSMRFGGGFGEPLLLSPLATGLRWVRLRFTSPHFRYVAMHAGLHSPIDSALIVGPGGATTSLAATERRMALHRYEVILHPSLLLAFSEALVYSARPLDLAYLNPVNVLFFAEVENQDRDNAMWVAEAVWRPLARVELNGTLFADDLGKLYYILPTLSPHKNTHRAFDFGASVALPRGVDVSGKHLRIEPFVYTHWQLFNTYEQNGFPLGNTLGPNADRWLLRVRKWLPARGWVAASISKTRKGLNPIDPAGQVTFNAGGDLELGTTDDPSLRVLEGADVQRYVEVGLEGAFEPVRGVRLSASYVWRDPYRGYRVDWLSLLTLRVSLGY